MNKKIIILLIATLLIAAALGGAWFFYTNKQKQKTVNENKEEKVIIETLIGEVKQIGRDNIIVTVNIDQAATEEKKASDIEVTIDDKTKLERNTSEVKSEEEFYNEQSDFQAALSEIQKEDRANLSIVEPPSWYKTEIISLSDLTVGEKIKIVANKDSNNKYVAVVVVTDSNQTGQDIEQPIDANPETMVAGIISLIDGTSIFLKDLEAADTASGSQPIKVLFNDRTSFIVKEKKSDSEFAKEQAEFNKKIENLKKEKKSIYGLTAPQYYSEKTFDKSQLAIGQRLNVYGWLDSAQAEILANKIEFIEEDK